MSVINKMLRDLDARRAGGSLPQLQRQGGPDALLGTVSVGAAAQPSAAHGGRWWLAAVLLFAGSGLAAWYLLEGAAALPPAPVPAAVVAVTPPASAPVMSPAAETPEPTASAPADTASAPVAAASGVVPAPALVASPASPPASAAAASEPSKSAGERAAPPAARETRAAAPVSVAAKAPPRRPAERPARPAAPAAKAVPPQAPVPAAPAQRQQAAAQETLAQAQALWAAGSREAAVDLVRAAALLAERSQPPDTALLAMLVREQTRMELAQGRPAAVLDLLTRLEPSLSTQADLWAVRGNAAQRLGRHAESVLAYTRALQLRPGESRWMLGAAVSLAAQGQLDAAAQQAEQARALGPVSPEVLHYLRQAGVPLR